MRLAYQGCTTQGKNLVVYFDLRLGRAAHPHSILVPLEDLLQGAVVEAMDRQHRRALIAAWSEVDLSDPLF